MSDPEGFIIIHRKIINWEWYTDVNTAHLFLYCLLRANYSDTSWRGIELKRGSFITSLETLSIETGLTVKQVRIALQKLINTGEVANKSTSKFRIITVNNYDLYQGEGKQKGRREGKQRATDNNNNNITSEGLRRKGAKPSPEEGKQAALDIAPPEGGESSPQKTTFLAAKSCKDERAATHTVRGYCPQTVPPLSTSEWLAYCSLQKHDGDIWEQWEALDNGRRLTPSEILEIRERLSNG